MPCRGVQSSVVLWVDAPVDVMFAGMAQWSVRLPNGAGVARDCGGYSQVWWAVVRPEASSRPVVSVGQGCEFPGPAQLSRSTRIVRRFEPSAVTAALLRRGSVCSRARASSSGSRWAVPAYHRFRSRTRTRASAWILRTY